MAKASQPVYLPRHPPRDAGDDDYAEPIVEVVREGSPLDIDALLTLYRPVIEAEQRRKAQRSAGTEGLRPAGSFAYDLINDFNAKFDLPKFLVDKGYRRKSRDRFMSPLSKSGRAALLFFEDTNTVISYHTNDELAQSDEYGIRRPVDAFHAYCVLEFANDAQRARIAAEAMGVGLGWWEAGKHQASFKANGAAYVDTEDFNEDDDEDGLHPLRRPLIHDDAMLGVIGEFARLIADDSEISREAAAVNLLIRIAAFLGRAAYYPGVGSMNMEHLRLSALIVGPSSTGRKGSSIPAPRALMKLVIDQMGAEVPPRELLALSTGEGLIEYVRDEQRERQRNKKGEMEEVVIPGVEDKRLVVLTEEFVTVLAKSARKDSTLNTILRLALEGRDLQNPTRFSALKATRPHICLIAQGVEEEVMAVLKDEDIYGGTINRMLLVASERSRLVARPKQITEADLQPFVSRITDALQLGWGRKSYRAADEDTVKVDFDPAALALWEKPDSGTYAELNDTTGMSVIEMRMVARAPIHCALIASIYALLDGSTDIRVEHLLAGRAWTKLTFHVAKHLVEKQKRAELRTSVSKTNRLREQDRVIRVVEKKVGKKLEQWSQQVLTELKKSPTLSMPRSAVYKMFHNNINQAKYEEIIRLLEGKVECVIGEKTGGRRSEVIKLKQPQ